MKLVYSEFDYQIIFQENRLNVVCIESKEKFREFIAELKKQLMQGEGKFVLSEDEKELDLSKHMELISDVFELNFSQKKILNRIYSIFESRSKDEDFYLDTCKIQADLKRYMEQLIMESDYPLHYTEEISIAGLCKFMDVGVDMEYETFPEQLIDYITVIHELFGCCCFVFINLKSFLSAQELEAIHCFTSYKKIFLLLLENQPPSQREEFEDYFFWDQDLCEIY